jgi:hypothetical protein
MLVHYSHSRVSTRDNSNRDTVHTHFGVSIFGYRWSTGYKGSYEARQGQEEHYEVIKTPHRITR